MTGPGPVLFVDLAKAARSEPTLLAAAIGVDPHRAKLLLQARAPFLSRGFPDLASAERAAAMLREGHVPATAHARERLDAVPAAREATLLEHEEGTWTADTNPGRLAIPAAALTTLVQGKLTVQTAASGVGGEDATLPRLGGLGGFGGAARRRRPAAREALHVFRLDLFATMPDGAVLRVAIRHDLFDFRCLGDRKTLSAVRNLSALRDQLARSRAAGQDDVPACDAFDRTELARNSLAPDVFVTSDIRSGAKRSESVRSNRASFETFAALRFLHEAALRPARPSHHFEL